MCLDQLKNEAVDLLVKLIKTPSFSKEEKNTGEIIAQYLGRYNAVVKKYHNNILGYFPHHNESKPSILLNSHHDTVKVVDGWTKDPFGGQICGERLYGLGANDAGASLVGLIATFLYFLGKEDLPFNLIFAASAEEEIFGDKGMAFLVSHVFDNLDLAIVGEPTGMDIAIAEKGLMVIDGYTKGVSSHAALNGGVNAIDLALIDVAWINGFHFDLVSSVLGETKMTVTQIEGGYQHNVIPDACHYVIDIRVNELYTLEEVLKIIEKHTSGIIRPRSMKWRPSGISASHPIIQKGIALGMKTYGSATLSDQVHLTHIPSVKLGVGHSSRSHTPDEYILLDELDNGIEQYIALIDGLSLQDLTYTKTTHNETLAK